MLLQVNGARIHYERSGSGFPVVFLHAGIADSRMWEPEVAAFAEHFDVVRPDQRGFGRSELPAMRWSARGDLLQIMDSLALKPAHLVGCSMGASLAIDFALDHPERVSKLVLVGPGISGANFGKKYPDIWADVKAADEARDLAALNQAEMKLFLAGPRRPVESIDTRLRDLFLDMNGTSLKSDFDSAPTDDIDPPAVGRLGEISAPTLIVVGDEDVPPVLDATELLMEKVAGARKAVIHDAAHLPNLEHPEEFNRLVLDFLLS
jgi:pimeloyl-ACP methyl ester carboxylesterase